MLPKWGNLSHVEGGGHKKFLGTIVLKRELEVLAILKGDVKRFHPALNGGGGAQKMSTL